MNEPNRITECSLLYGCEHCELSIECGCVRDARVHLIIVTVGCMRNIVCETERAVSGVAVHELVCLGVCAPLVARSAEVKLSAPAAIWKRNEALFRNENNGTRENVRGAFI